MLWDAEFLRMTVFPTPDSAERPSLAALLGKPVDEITERPQANFRQEVAALEDAHVFLTHQSGRVDLVLGVANPNPATGIISVGPYDKVKIGFLELAKHLLNKMSPVNRLAYAPSLVAPSPDHVTAYKTLASMLPFIKIDGEKSKELTWQINRPRPSKVMAESEINRITKWSVLRIQPLTIQADSLVVLTPNAPALAVKLEMDVSTPAQGTVIAETNVLNVFDELVSLADEIAEKGDIQ
jgi:hypothetical protein